MVIAVELKHALSCTQFAIGQDAEKPSAYRLSRDDGALVANEHAAFALTQSMEAKTGFLYSSC